MNHKFDLNLLNTFDALWRERNVTRAARRLSVTQPAVSNSLSRLRDAFGDELFIRTPTGVEPTERCVEIASELKLALQHVDRALAPTDKFDPASSERVFRIGAMDYFDNAVLPLLMQALASRAPGVDLRVSPLANRNGFTELDNGDLDFMFFDGGEPPKRISFECMLQERFVLIMSDDHPAACKSLSLEEYAALDHIVFSTRGDGSTSVDDLLSQSGLTRRIALTSSHHTSIAVTVRETKLVAMSPSRLAKRFEERGGLVARPAPLEVEGFNINLFWSRRLNTDPGAMWLRDLIRDVCKGTPLYEPAPAG